MSTKPQRRRKYRNSIEDSSFYKIRHQFDELPLDPVVTFIQEKIRKYQRPFVALHAHGTDEFSFVTSAEKMRSSRGVNFVNDLDLYTNEVNESRRYILTNDINNKSLHNPQKITENGTFDWTALKQENYGNTYRIYQIEIHFLFDVAIISEEKFSN